MWDEPNIMCPLTFLSSKFNCFRDSTTNQWHFHHSLFMNASSKCQATNSSLWSRCMNPPPLLCDQIEGHNFVIARILPRHRGTVPLSGLCDWTCVRFCRPVYSREGFTVEDAEICSVWVHVWTLSQTCRSFNWRRFQKAPGIRLISH